MGSIVFFAASRDQRNYFSELSQSIDLDSEVIWYKSLKVPSLFIKYPFSELWHQAELLTVRKRNSSKGKHYPKIIWPLFTAISFLQACWLYGTYVSWLKNLQIGHVGIWNGKKFRQAVLVIALKTMKKHPIFFETGPLPGFSAIDPKGVNFYSSIPNNVEFYLNRHLSNTEGSQALPIQSTRPASLPKHFILVPFQVVEDSNIYLHSQWIRNMRQLFALCQTLSKQLKGDVVFVFKEHPSCDEQYNDLRNQQAANLKFIDDFSTSDLVQYADAIITVNSTVGIEGLIARKKVFVLGDALFGIDGISYPVDSEQALLKLLVNIEKLALNEKAISNFIDYLKHDYGIVQNAMKNPGSEHWAAANERLALLIEGKSSEALKLLN
ncbi:capsular polysaccharide export protein, LipB/KpsS family [Thiomicrorhabdus lithotrophica]|uniref:CDP-glycerol glycerophosphotransferase family protein n=1 Tax=Thiomicrorhabdus lithotrophica TaxID=2949997 RepID=A0ABY8C844_9GAMM|nr:CDP-glycerol glycerophosphotransferase family protein [Thiomicrorhabdus lithotrophica]WEJ62129.1 CDP-glycerol glycerophosphotransferase family protein [Thiomicrorhabdus lithotrophica]